MTDKNRKAQAIIHAISCANNAAIAFERASALFDKDETAYHLEKAGLEISDRAYAMTDLMARVLGGEVAS